MNRDQHMEQFKQASIEAQRHQTMLEGAVKLYRASRGKEVDVYHSMARAQLDGILDAERKMQHHLAEATKLLGSE